MWLWFFKKRTPPPPPPKAHFDDWISLPLFCSLTLTWNQHSGPTIVPAFVVTLVSRDSVSLSPSHSPMFPASSHLTSGPLMEMFRLMRRASGESSPVSFFLRGLLSHFCRRDGAPEPTRFTFSHVLTHPLDCKSQHQHFYFSLQCFVHYRF